MQTPRRSLIIATVFGIAVIVTVALWIRNAQIVARASAEKKRQAERSLLHAGYWQHLTKIEKTAIANAPKDDEISTWKGLIMLSTTHGLDAIEKKSRGEEIYWKEYSVRVVELSALGVDAELTDYANRRAGYYINKALSCWNNTENVKWARKNWAGLHLIEKLFDPYFQKRVDELDERINREKENKAALEKEKLELEVLRASVRGILSRRYSSDFQL